MTTLIAPIVQACDAISGARPGARREVVESYIKRLKDMEDLALSYNGVVKTYAIQAGRELRVVVGSEKISDAEAEKISFDIAKRIQDEMTCPGQVKVTVIRETRAINYAKYFKIHLYKKQQALPGLLFFIPYSEDGPFVPFYSFSRSKHAKSRLFYTKHQSHSF